MPFGSFLFGHANNITYYKIDMTWTVESTAKKSALPPNSPNPMSQGTGGSVMASKKCQRLSLSLNCQRLSVVWYFFVTLKNINIQSLILSNYQLSSWQCELVALVTIATFNTTNYDLEVTTSNGGRSGVFFWNVRAVSGRKSRWWCGSNESLVIHAAHVLCIGCDVDQDGRLNPGAICQSVLALLIIWTQTKLERI